MCDLHAHFPNQLNLVYYYFERHIDLDENEHTPAAKRMVQELCKTNEDYWIEAQQAVKCALEARTAVPSYSISSPIDITAV